MMIWMGHAASAIVSAETLLPKVKGRGPTRSEVQD